jgi:carbamoyl-phosphate synthase/aspartate carbamoyltransferase
LTCSVAKTDVLYVTRVQQERFTDAAEYERVKNAYVVNNELLAGAKEHCIVMHPLPRNAELDPGVDVSTLELDLFFANSRKLTLSFFSFPLLLPLSSTNVVPHISGKVSSRPLYGTRTIVEN